MARRVARVEVVCVGTELLSGQVNTHAAFLAGRLRTAGLRLGREATVADETEEIADAVGSALARSEAVLVLGGLGPTFDDLTREGTARALSRGLVFRPELMRTIRSRFKARGLPMAPANRRQAYLVEGASALRNPNGSAPGQLIELGSGAGRKLIALLPGPLNELRPMFDLRVLPRLRRLSGGRPAPSVSLHLSGVVESEADRRLRPVVKKHPELVFTILASGGLVHVHASDYRPDAPRTLAPLRRELVSRLGKWLVAEGESTLEAEAGRLLRSRGETLALAESLTGGLVGHLITEVPGSSDYFEGGVAAYANEAKMDLLGVRRATLAERGAVSEACALEMAEGARRRFGADWALSLTGIAGPTGGSPLKPVGLTWIGLAGPGGAWAERRRFSGDRSLIKVRAARTALELLWRALRKPAGARPRRRA